jgi:hypothetical protein
LPDVASKTVDVVRRSEVAAVDGEQVLPFCYVHTGLRQRRAEVQVPVLAVVDANEAVPAVFNPVVGTEKASRDIPGLRQIAAFDAKVANCDLAHHVGEQVCGRAST